MPKNITMLHNLQKKYGDKKWEEMYYKLEAIAKKKHPWEIPFQHKTLQERINEVK